MKTVIAAACLVLLAACSTTGDSRGWTGAGAQPFDAANAECRAQAGDDNAAFEACMAGKGWTRPR